MQWGLLWCFFLPLVYQTVDGQQEVLFSATYLGPPVDGTTDVLFGVTFYRNADPITQLWIVDRDNPAQNPNCTVNVTGGEVIFNFVIEAGTNPKHINFNGLATDCPFTNDDPSSSSYTVTLLSKIDPESTDDREQFFDLTVEGSDVPPGSSVTGTQAFTVFKNTFLTPVNYNPTLEITDGTGNVMTLLSLGAAAQLRFTMTIENYTQFVDDAGARVTNCYMSENIDFTAPVTTVIDSNGCFTAVLNLNSNEGFSGSSSLDGTTRTFTATTPSFEVINFNIINVMGNKNLYFQCEVEYCRDDTSMAAGTCGGSHCSNAKRKKRSTGTVHTVRTSLTVVGENEKKKKCKKTCKVSDTYKATLGALTGLSVILFFGMIFSYKSKMNDIERRKEYQRNKAGPSIAHTPSGGSVSEGSTVTIVKKPASDISSSFAGRRAMPVYHAYN